MEIIKPSFQIMAMTGHPELPYQYQPNPELLIEAAGRTCYKSEDKITEGSAKKFVEMAEKRKHFTILEHSWEVRYYESWHLPPFEGPVGNWNKFLYISEVGPYIAGNSRAFKEAEILNTDLVNYSYCKLNESEIKSLFTEFNEPFLMAATVRIICDRGVSHEIVRHRPPVYSQESTRYCDYSKKGIQFIEPLWFNPDNPISQSIWREHMANSEKEYMQLIIRNWSPQQARSVLPNSLKTELVMTCPLSEWQHIFRQRALGLTGAPHPQMVELSYPLWKEFEKMEPIFFSEEVLRRM